MGRQGAGCRMHACMNVQLCLLVVPHAQHYPKPYTRVETLPPTSSSTKRSSVRPPRARGKNPMSSCQSEAMRVHTCS